MPNTISVEMMINKNNFFTSFLFDVFCSLQDCLACMHA